MYCGNTHGGREHETTKRTIIAMKTIAILAIAGAALVSCCQQQQQQQTPPPPPVEQPVVVPTK